MGDLIGFQGYLNESTPFDTEEHPVLWKSERRYADFDIGYDYNQTCQFPRLWDESGYPVDQEVMEQFNGCYNGDFDQVTTSFSVNSPVVAPA
jgi:alpha-1,3-glucan synthase